MLGLFPSAGQAAQSLSESIQNHTLLKDTNVLPHLGRVLANINEAKSPADIIHVSNLVKQTQPLPHAKYITIQAQLPVPLSNHSTSTAPCQLPNLQAQMDKLKWAGFSLPKEEVYLLQEHLRNVAKEKRAYELRFWGKIFGTQKDYFILQGLKEAELTLEDVPVGAQKRGEGANYFSFWVSTNLLQKEWTELPQIHPHHLTVARKVKAVFTGQLGRPINSFPVFAGEERHYLKAQLVRMTSSLEIVPKGVFKVNQDNPKVVEYEDEPKIPDFAQLASLESWQHRNQNLLLLGRCTHFIDPTTPEDQLEALTAELTEKDPEVERLRSITEDKLPEGNPLGLENVWQARVFGNTQVFQKEEAAVVYGVVAFRNVLWPGWVSIGYKGGFCNYYVGYGQKLTQPGWSENENPGLSQEAEEVSEFHEPNPKDPPKPEAEVAAAEGDGAVQQQ